MQKQLAPLEQNRQNLVGGGVDSNRFVDVQQSLKLLLIDPYSFIGPIERMAE
jgi:hypothetical protein